MDIATVQFMSQALWRQVTYTVLLPNKERIGQGPYPVLLQLHGGNQDHSSWVSHSQLIDHAEGLPFIIVLPDGAQSRWANGRAPFEAYEDFLMNDLYEHVSELFPAIDCSWAIGGNSMGGFGAIRLGLKYPHRFFSIWSHSACFPLPSALPDHWHWTGDPNCLDCYSIVEQIDQQQIPLLSFDCGSNDHLLEDNRRFHQHLLKHNVPHNYFEHEGGHDWAYWNMHVPEALLQHYTAFMQL